MGQGAVRDFDHLLARLDGLAEAAQQGGAEPRMVEHLRNLRRRVWAINEYLRPGQAPSQPPAAEPESPLDSSETLSAFRALLEAAEEAGIHMTLVDFLRNAGHRLDNIQRGVPDHRLAPRQPEEGDARLEHAGVTYQVRIAESSSFGLGVEIATPLEPDQVVRLVVSEAFGATTYECLTTHARPKGDTYHMGLEIFSIRI